jgi:DNA polymerase-1
MATAKKRKRVKTISNKREAERQAQKQKVVFGAMPKLLKGKKPACMLLDAEIVMYNVLGNNLDEIYDRTRDVYQWEVNRANARADFSERVLGLARWMKAKRIILGWGMGSCFRRSFIGSYKLDRLKFKKPLGYWALVEWAQNNPDWESIKWPRLEADDVLGIFATDPVIKRKYTPVIVSDDKDLKTIPGLHLRIRSVEDNDAAGGMFDVTPKEADRFHLVQTLTGDPGDGYFGLAGVGPSRAEQILAATGPNKDAREVLPPLSVWERVVWAYEKEELGEDDALANARCARILRHGDYDTATGNVNAWDPPKTLKRRPKK